MIDVAADETGIDPAELRRKNYLQPGAFPLTTLTGANYDCGEYEEDARRSPSKPPATNRSGPSRRNDANRATPSSSGSGCPRTWRSPAPLGLHVEWGGVEIHEDGTASAKVGTSAHGQGHHTAFAMILSSQLGIPMENVKLVQSDTDEVPPGRRAPWAPAPCRPPARRFTRRASPVLAKAKTLAAHLLEASEDDIVVGDGGLEVTGTPASNVSWADLAKAANDDSKRPDGMDPGLAHELDFDGQDSTFPFGSHVSVVEVDTEDRAGRDAPPRRRRRLRADPEPPCSSPASSTAASPRVPPRPCTKSSPTTTTATRSPAT